MHHYLATLFFLEHAGELRIIVLIEEERVIHRPNTPHTRAHLATLSYPSRVSPKKSNHIL
jgi:hypothetical protein